MRVTSRPTLVLLRALGLGDLLTAVPAIRAVARAFPEHYRVLAAPLYLAPLVALCGGVDEVIDSRPLEPLASNLAGIDVAINLHGRGPQSHRILLQTRPRHFVAFTHPEISRSAGYPQWRPDEHEIDRWCRMLRESGIPADAGDLRITTGSDDARARGAIVIHPGAASESRRWPAASWIDLCSRLRAQGQRVVLTGSPSEFRRCRFIAKAARLPIDAVVAGKTDLADLAALIACARGIVCGDTGVAHIATAAGTPSVILFGPTSPLYWGPPPSRPYHHMIWRGTAGNPHAPFVDPGLASITVEEVLAELYTLLQTAQAG